jgi:alkanesulfonate monooxygenase SsuD/methylene tetrahydromethanopterin reductase-like flavin-dependent oxidoreductase (luciferase family)
MKIGIGLPNPVPGTPGRRLVDWGRRAEERGFSGLATIDRIVYPSHDTLTTLAAVAGATSRIGLLSNILVGPAYPAALVAKSAATIHGVSEGRFTLGLGVGGRPDDFAATGLDFHTRGRRLDEALELMRATWAGKPVGALSNPLASPVDGGEVPVLIGGTSDQAVERAARWGTGWTSGGAPPEAAAAVVVKVERAWTAAGRTGEPRLAALAYFSLGDDVVEASHDYLRNYYAFLGDYADVMGRRALRSEQAIADAVRAFGDAGITELYFDPTTNDLHQVDRLADLVL